MDDSLLRLGDIRSVSHAGSTHTLYEILVIPKNNVSKDELETFGNRKKDRGEVIGHRVAKRWQDIQSFRTLLVKSFPQLKNEIPSLAEETQKTSFFQKFRSRTGSRGGEDRKKQLETFLTFIATSEAIAASDDNTLQTFLYGTPSVLGVSTTNERNNKRGSLVGAGLAAQSTLAYTSSSKQILTDAVGDVDHLTTSEALEVLNKVPRSALDGTLDDVIEQHRKKNTIIVNNGLVYKDKNSGGTENSDNNKTKKSPHNDGTIDVDPSTTSSTDQTKGVATMLVLLRTEKGNSAEGAAVSGKVTNASATATAAQCSRRFFSLCKVDVLTHRIKWELPLADFHSVLRGEDIGLSNRTLTLLTFEKRSVASVSYDIVKRDYLCESKALRDEWFLVFESSLREFWQQEFESYICVRSQNLASTATLLQRPEIYQSHFHISKINRKGVMQARFLLLSDSWLYNLKFHYAPTVFHSLKWAIPIEGLEMIELIDDAPRFVSLKVDVEHTNALIKSLYNNRRQRGGTGEEKGTDSPRTHSGTAGNNSTLETRPRPASSVVSVGTPDIGKRKKRNLVSSFFSSHSGRTRVRTGGASQSDHQLQRGSRGGEFLNPTEEDDDPTYDVSTPFDKSELRFVFANENARDKFCHLIQV
eukprot:g2805.t1